MSHGKILKRQVGDILGVQFVLFFAFPLPCLCIVFGTCDRGLYQQVQNVCFQIRPCPLFWCRREVHRIKDICR